MLLREQPLIITPIDELRYAATENKPYEKRLESCIWKINQRAHRPIAATGRKPGMARVCVVSF
jgi:hypothetical protein